MAKQSSNATRYVVAHNGMGRWTRGDVVTSDDLADIDTDRLLEIGAIVPEEAAVRLDDGTIAHTDNAPDGEAAPPIDPNATTV